MQIKLIVVGKTKEQFLESMMNDYIKRTQRFIEITVKVVKELNNNDSRLQKQQESENVLQKIESSDYVVLLDETGKKFSSTGFAQKIKSWQDGNTKSVVFVIGGAYGFSDELYKRANEKMSLSKLTFSHQMVRVVFLEQLYRAYSILNNEPYHHE